MTKTYYIELFNSETEEKSTFTMEAETSCEVLKRLQNIIECVRCGLDINITCLSNKKVHEQSTKTD